MGKRGGIVKGGITDPLINIEPGDNNKYLTTALEVKALGQKKVNLSSYHQVEDRINDYFRLMAERDQKPTMTGLAMSMGYSYNRLSEIIKNQPVGGNKGYAAKMGYIESPSSPEVRELLTMAMETMKILWEDYMQNGKINPASGIFLGKNFYGMRDEVEHVITPNVNPVDNYNAEDIVSRYLAEDTGKDKKKT